MLVIYQKDSFSAFIDPNNGTHLLIISSLAITSPLLLATGFLCIGFSGLNIYKVLYLIFVSEIFVKKRKWNVLVWTNIKTFFDIDCGNALPIGCLVFLIISFEKEVHIITFSVHF